MAIGVIWNPPIDAQTYDAVRERVFQAGIEKGLKFHAAGAAGGGWRVVEIWESREALERFKSEDLARAFNEVSGAQGEPPEPETVFEVHYQGP